MTYMTCFESDAVEINKYLDFFDHQGIEVYPVHLAPHAEALLERSVSIERQQSHKLSCPDKMTELLNKMKFIGIEHPNSISINNTNLCPEDVATMIVAHVK